MAAPTPGTGWEIDVLLAADFTTVIGKVQNVNSLMVSKVLSDCGQANVVLPLDDPTLGAPLPPGATSTVLVRQAGTYPDPITRADALAWKTTTIPGTQKGFVDTHGYEQYLRASFNGTITGTARNVRSYFFYEDDSNCMFLDWGVNGSGYLNLWVVIDGVKNHVANSSYAIGDKDYTNAPLMMRASRAERTVAASFRSPSGGVGGSITWTFSTTDPLWVFFKPGTKIGYDTTVGMEVFGGGVHDTASNLTVETSPTALCYTGTDERIGSFLVTGFGNAVGDGWKPDLGSFPVVGGHWWTPVDVDAAQPNVNATYMAMPMNIRGNKFVPGWMGGPNTDGGVGGSTALFDIGTPNGSWQFAIGSSDGVFHPAECGLIVRANTDATAGYFVYPKTASPGYGIYEGLVLNGTQQSVAVDTPNQPGSVSTQAWAMGDILRVIMAGTHLTVFRNSTLLGAHLIPHQPTSSIVGVFNYTRSGPFGQPDNYAPWETPPDSRPAFVYSTIDDPTFIGTTETYVTQTPVNLLADENAWVVKRDGRTVLAFLNETPNEVVIADNGLKVVTVAGRGIGAVLEWAKVLPPGWPTPVTDDHTYTAVVAMNVWLQLLQENQDRGTLTFVDVTFTATADSDGTPWADTNDLTISPGDTLLSLLQRFASLVGFDWQARLDTTTGIVYIDAWLEHGLDRTQTVVFWPGYDIQDQKRFRDRTAIGNYIAAKGTGPDSETPFYTTAQHVGSTARWRQREMWVDAGDAQSLTQTRQVANAALGEVKDEYASLTSQVLVDKAGRVMFEDYDYGDTVYVHTDDTSMDGAYKIVALSCSVGDGESGEITLLSRRDIQLMRLQRTLDRMGAGSIGPSAASF